MSAALWLYRVDWDVLIRLVQVIVAGVGLFIAQQGLRNTVRGLAQKAESDNRAEWWKRYTWAMEKVYDQREEVTATGWELLDFLSQSPLATNTEVEIINRLTIPSSDYTESEEG